MNFLLNIVQLSGFWLTSHSYKVYTVIIRNGESNAVITPLNTCGLAVIQCLGGIFNVKLFLAFCWCVLGDIFLYAILAVVIAVMMMMIGVGNLAIAKNIEHVMQPLLVRDKISASVTTKLEVGSSIPFQLPLTPESKPSTQYLSLTCLFIFSPCNRL